MRITIKNHTELNYLLEKYGRWKRDYVIGLGYPPSSVEMNIRSGGVFGDGCSGGGGKIGYRDPIFKEDAESSYINRCINQMKKTHTAEMKVLDLIYVCDWSVKKIAEEIGSSRYQVKQLLDRSKTLIEGWMIRD